MCCYCCCSWRMGIETCADENSSFTTWRDAHLCRLGTSSAWRTFGLGNSNQFVCLLLSVLSFPKLPHSLEPDATYTSFSLLSVGLSQAKQFQGLTNHLSKLLAWTKEKNTWLFFFFQLVGIFGFFYLLKN